MMTLNKKIALPNKHRKDPLI